MSVDNVTHIVAEVGSIREGYDWRTNITFIPDSPEEQKMKELRTRWESMRG